MNAVLPLGDLGLVNVVLENSVNCLTRIMSLAPPKGQPRGCQARSSLVPRLELQNKSLHNTRNYDFNYKATDAAAMPNKSSFCVVSCPGFGHRANDVVPHESCCMHTRFYCLIFFLTLTLSHFCFVSVVTRETNCLSFSWLLFAGHESLVFQIVICTTCHP